MRSSTFRMFQWIQQILRFATFPIQRFGWPIFGLAKRSGRMHCSVTIRRADCRRRGLQIANTLPQGNKHEWAWVAQFLSREI